jgi:hypothetical protein
MDEKENSAGCVRNICCAKLALVTDCANPSKSLLKAVLRYVKEASISISKIKTPALFLDE